MPMKPDCEPLELLELERDRAIRTAAGSELEHTPLLGPMTVCFSSVVRSDLRVNRPERRAV